VFRVAYRDGSPADFAICLCAAGEPFRITENNGKQHVPHYRVWAIRHGIDPEHVAPMEVLLTDDELMARGFGELPPERATDALTDAIAAAARKRGAKR
jgi:hypothetical protein